MSGKWRARVSGQAALRSLLPLLLPPDRVAVTAGQREVLQRSDWLETAHQRGLAPALHAFLGQLDCWSAVPASTRESLESAYRENLANCMAREAVLGSVLEALEGLGAQPILLKGLALAAELYPEPAARLTGDIDLLVASTWKDEVTRRLQQAGFQLLTSPASPPAKFKSWLRLASRKSDLSSSDPSRSQAADQEGEAVFLTRIGAHDILIEIHYHLINLRAGGGKAAVFRSLEDGLPPTRTIRLAAGSVRVLDHTATFLHALRHLALHHRLIGFRWHHDLALMLVHWERFLDPERIREQCRQLNSEKILDVELALLGELFGPRILSEDGWRRWGQRALPWEYPLYRHVAKGGKRTPWRELVRTLLAPGLREQLETLT